MSNRSTTPRERMARAAIYRAAAARSLIEGDGLIILKDTALINEFWAHNNASVEGVLTKKEHYCMAICFLAAMAETGDA